MGTTLTIFLLILLLCQLFLIVRTVKLKRLSMKYASFWIILIIAMSVIVIFPKLLFIMSDFFGFEKTSNMIFLLGFFFLFYVIFILNTSICNQNEKIRLLIQEISILKERVDKDGKEK